MGGSWQAGNLTSLGMVITGRQPLRIARFLNGGFGGARPTVFLHLKMVSKNQSSHSELHERNCDETSRYWPVA